MPTANSSALKPRPLVYLALQNGGRRSTSFTPDHRDRFSSLVRVALDACPDSRVHAFSWTSSDIRIALEASPALVGQFVRELSARHRERMHAEICGSECLFERGYGGTPIDDDRGLLHVVEHIHNAPVRAGLAAHASDYRWSSCRAYFGLEHIAWLTTGIVARLLETAEKTTGSSYGRRRGLNEQREAFRVPV